MAERVDVAVVGGGVMGLATAWALARAGREPVVLEQFRIGHTRGSSHGATRIFRLAYEEVEWVHMAREALGLWRELEQESGEQLLELTGLVDIAPDPTPLTTTLEASGTPYELLDPPELEHRFGLVTQCCKAVFQPEAGVVRADGGLAAFRAGIDVREETHVRTIAQDGDGVRIETDVVAFGANLVVVAAGAWARPQLAAADIDLAVAPTRETVAYFDFGGQRSVPSVIDHRDRETYALTAGPGRLKVGIHRSGPPTDPDEAGVTDEAIVNAASDWAARIFRLESPEPAAVETCLYTNTADARFVLERHDRIVVCSACSGHGFKFAPAVGVRTAELVSEVARPS